MAYRLLLGALSILAVAASAGGFSLTTDPSGESLGLALAALDGSPFSNYRIPGLFLLVVLGVFPLIVVWALSRGKRWSWYGALFVGVGLCVFLAVEILCVGYHSDPPLQAFFGVLALVLVALVFSPSVRRRLPFGPARSGHRRGFSSSSR